MGSVRRFDAALVLLVLLIDLPAFAAAPANDSFETPTVVSGFPATALGSNVDATMETGEPTPGGYDSVGASVWFRWTAPASGAIQIHTFGSDFDTVLAVWTGNTLSTLTLVDMDDDDNGLQSRVFMDATGGTTYQIAVYGYSESDQGNVALHITNDLTSTISGTVTGPDGTTPLEGIEATAYLWDEDGEYWDSVGNGYTDENGLYAIGGLNAGTYRVRFYDGNGEYLAEYYDNVPDIGSAADIAVPASTVVSNINASLAQAAGISGTVTGPDGTTPLEGIEAAAYFWDEDGEYWNSVGYGYTDENGLFAIGGLNAGTYRVRFYDWNGEYLAEYYDNVQDIGSAADIAVPASTVVSNIDASLAQAAGISGTVTGPDGTTPLEGIWVYACTGNLDWTDWDWVAGDDTDANGYYSIGGLEPGTYRIIIYGGGNYLTEVYSNAPSLDVGMDIVVPAGTTVPNINASLAQAAGISGTVTGPDGITPVEGIGIWAYHWNADAERWDQVDSSTTDPNGFYFIGGLAAGTYRVDFTDYDSGNYLHEAYSNAPSLDVGMDIVVPAETIVTNIDASLATAGRISGTVNGPDDVTPLESIQATAYRWNGSDWEWIEADLTDSEGHYVIGGLETATYRVQFNDYNYGNYVSEVYNDAPSLDDGDDIAVNVGETAGGIDASLTLSAPLQPQLGQFQRTGANAFELTVTGENRSYQLQWTASVTGGWNNASAPFTCDNGSATLPLVPDGTIGFWRVKLAP